jgi:quercetin dioxygenase-like cupin family protein
MAQDPVNVDPKHYKVEFENDKVRVLRVSYDPGEKSTMHGHPNAVAVFLGDAGAKFTYPDGKTENVEMKAGQATWFPAVEHLPENVADKPIRLILVELK